MWASWCRSHHCRVQLIRQTRPPALSRFDPWSSGSLESSPFRRRRRRRLHKARSNVSWFYTRQRGNLAALSPRDRVIDCNRIPTRTEAPSVWVRIDPLRRTFFLVYDILWGNRLDFGNLRNSKWRGSNWPKDGSLVVADYECKVGFICNRRVSPKNPLVTSSFQIRCVVLRILVRRIESVLNFDPISGSSNPKTLHVPSFGFITKIGWTFSSQSSRYWIRHIEYHDSSDGFAFSDPQTIIREHFHPNHPTFASVSVRGYSRSGILNPTYWKYHDSTNGFAFSDPENPRISVACGGKRGIINGYTKIFLWGSQKDPICEPRVNTGHTLAEIHVPPEFSKRLGSKRHEKKKKKSTMGKRDDRRLPYRPCEFGSMRFGNIPYRRTCHAPRTLLWPRNPLRRGDANSASRESFRKDGPAPRRLSFINGEKFPRAPANVNNNESSTLLNNLVTSGSA